MSDRNGIARRRDDHRPARDPTDHDRPIDLEAMAEAIVRGGMWPEIDTREKALSLMLLCQAEGLHPVSAMKRYHIIEGKPSMRADTMLAEYKRRGGRVRWIQRSAQVAEAHFWHPETDPDGVTITVTYRELEEAGVTQSYDRRNQRWITKKNYRCFPRQMLSARVVSEGVRLIDPGVVAGVYTPEEVSDFSGRDVPLDEQGGAAPATPRPRGAPQPAPAGPDPGPAERAVDAALQRAADAWADYWRRQYRAAPPRGFPGHGIPPRALAGAILEARGQQPPRPWRQLMGDLALALRDDPDGFGEQARAALSALLYQAIRRQWEDMGQQAPEEIAFTFAWDEGRGRGRGRDDPHPAERMDQAVAHEEGDVAAMAARDATPHDQDADAVIDVTPEDPDEDPDVAAMAARDADPAPARARKGAGNPRRNGT